MNSVFRTVSACVSFSPSPKNVFLRTPFTVGSFVQVRSFHRFNDPNFKQSPFGVTSSRSVNALIGTPGPKRYYSRFSFDPATAERKEADANPSNAAVQFKLIKKLVEVGNFQEAVDRCGQNTYAVNEEIVKEYLKAYVRAQNSLANLRDIFPQHFYPHLRMYTNMNPSSSSNSNSSNSTNSYFSQNVNPSTPPQYAYQNFLLPEIQTVRLKGTPLSLFIPLWVIAMICLIVLAMVFAALRSGSMESILESGFQATVASPEAVKVSFDDVKGCDEVKEAVADIIDYLKNPDKYTKMGATLPKGILLVGPPGTGKTLLARAVAGEVNLPFIYANGSDFEQMYVGVGGARVRALFKAAKNLGGGIIFIDEIDAVGNKKSRHHEGYSALHALLSEMDGFEKTDKICVIAATNVKEVIDSALLRPGRFDRIVDVPLPDPKGREDILNHYLAKVKTAKDLMVHVPNIAKTTVGFSGADLYQVVNLATIKAASESVPVGRKHIDNAIDEQMMGLAKKNRLIDPAEKLMTAYHEAGHTLCAIHTEGAFPVHKVTVLERGHALGVTSYIPKEKSMSKKEMHALLISAMGGRAAEEVVFGPEEVTSGASSDIKNATALATQMVSHYGMSDEIGIIYLHPEDISPEMASKRDRETRRILDEHYATAKKILIEHRDQLELLARTLVVKETMTGHEVADLLQIPYDKKK